MAPDPDLIEVDPVYRHAIWVCPDCGKSKYPVRAAKPGTLIVGVCGKMTRFGGTADLAKCPECIDAMNAGRNKVCHYCAKQG